MNVAYLGGSITEGYGASKEEFTYRAQVTKWLGEEVHEINAGIGGTGSDLGVFRIYKDVISQKPDLVFVEFAVNDGNTPADRILRSMDGIVQKLLAYRADVRIVFLYTLCDEHLPVYDEQKVPYAIRQHHKVAEYYHIPEINMSHELYQHLRSSGDPFENYFIDGCHPSDEGYAFYAQTIFRYFPELNFQIRVREPMFADSFCNAAIIAPDEYAGGDWVLSEEGLYGRTSTCIYSETVGSEIVFPFHGSGIGLYLAIEKNSGDIVYSIDGGEEKEYRVWDWYAKIFNRANYVLLAPDLADGDHVLRVRISPNKDEESEGHCIKIGGFLVC